MIESGGSVRITTKADFPHLGIWAVRDSGIVIAFQHAEAPGVFVRIRNYLFAVFSVAFGLALLWLLLKFNIIPDYIPGGIPAIGAVLFCGFGVPGILIWLTGLWPTPFVMIERQIHFDPVRDQVRVYFNRKMRTMRSLSLFYTTTVEEHPKAQIERMKHGGKIGNYQKQHVLYGWFGVSGAEKVPLLSRWEWPYMNSLIEVQKAIELGKTLAQKMQAAAQGGDIAPPPGFGGRLAPADDDGGRPPLD